jgi:hypothetical protein
MSSAFGTGHSNGQFWFGGSTFPGFLYKKNVGVGGRRSTKMNPGGNITCNSSTYLYNKYTPGASGIGASSMSNRRAKNRLATVCRSGDGSNTKNCFPGQSTLGQYSNYTHNPNGFIPFMFNVVPAPIVHLTPTPTPTLTLTLTPTLTPDPTCPEKIVNGGIFNSNDDLESLRGCTIIIGSLEISNFDGQPDFSVFNCLQEIRGNLFFIFNELLTSISGFPALTSVIGSFFFINNTALEIISGFPLLISITNGLTIGDNESLTSISGFPLLTSITNGFTINDNVSLISMSEFPALTIIRGNFLITNNSTLTLVSGFSALTNIIGDFYINYNSTLSLVSGFSALINIIGAIYINNNTELASISGFENLNPNPIITTGVDSFVSSINICQTTYDSIFQYYGSQLNFTGSIDTGC